MGKEPASSTEPDFKPKTILFTKDNVVVSGTLLVCTIGLTIMVMAKLNSIENRLDRVSDRWTRPQMREYSYRLWRENPTLKAPDPDAIATQIP